MTLSCSGARERFSGYLDERLVREDRSAVREHLAECPECRAEAAVLDPAFLFAFSGAQAAAVSPEDTQRILAAVRTGIELKSAERRIAPPDARRRTPVRRAIGSAAAVAAAAFVAIIVVSARREVPPPDATRAATAIAPVAASARPASPPAEPAAISPFVEASGPSKNQRLPADATIYDWNPGGGQPRVVWIVDRSLDI